MPISFKVIESKNYFISLWEGEAKDTEMIDSYINFYEGKEWIPSLNELVDLSHADVSKISSSGLSSLAGYIERHFSAHSVASTKTAVFSPNDLPFGMARIYKAMSFESPEEVQVFRDFNQAEAWLLDLNETSS